MFKKKKYLFFMICALIGCIMVYSNNPSEKVFKQNAVKEALTEVEAIPFNEFVELKNDGKIDAIYYEKTNEFFYFQNGEKDFSKATNPEYDTFKKEMMESDIAVKTNEELYEDFATLKEITGSKERMQADAPGFILGIISILCLVMYVTYDSRHKYDIESNSIPIQPMMRTSGSFSSSSEPSPADIVPVKHTFKDIAGLHEVKKDVACLVDFLKNQDKYMKAGAKLPKGVIFYGPPGTGKTLLAKAIAGEAGIPFLYTSGSDFMEMYVGVGAKRIRQLFADARKKAPCIIFIDEIDAIGGTRMGGEQHSEDRKTLNALLAEMDGFKASDNIVVIGATNTVESLDPALLRPGRFTNKYCVPLPASASERLEVIHLYAKNKKFAEDVNFDSIAKETMGFSPASIEYLLNEAAIISVQDSKKFIDRMSIDKAMTKTILSGHIKENTNDRDKEELRVVAWHEAGHALVGKLLGKDIPKVTILSSTTGAGGVTFSSPKTETGLYTVADLRHEVMELYAGRIAEKLCNGKNNVTTGASNDIERATNIIKHMVVSFGMSDEYGLLNLEQLKVSADVVINKQIELSKEIEKEVTDLMTEHYHHLEKIATLLIEKETLYDKDIDDIINDRYCDVIDATHNVTEEEQLPEEEVFDATENVANKIEYESSFIS